MKTSMLSFLLFALTFLWSITISVVAHELCHYITLKVLGGSGFVRGTICYGTLVPGGTITRVVVSFAGGLGCGVIFLALQLCFKDVFHRVMFGSIGSFHLSYGLMEGLWDLLGRSFSPVFISVAAAAFSTAYIFNDLRNSD